MTDTRKIIDFAMDEDAVGVREAMYSALHDRVMAAIDAKKQEVGAIMMGMPLATEQVEQEEDTLDEKWAKEEKEEGHEDEAEDEKMCKDIAKKEVKGHEKRMHGKKEVEKEGY